MLEAVLNNATWITSGHTALNMNKYIYKNIYIYSCFSISQRHSS